MIRNKNIKLVLNKKNKIILPSSFVNSPSLAFAAAKYLKFNNIDEKLIKLISKDFNLSYKFYLESKYRNIELLPIKIQNSMCGHTKGLDAIAKYYNHNLSLVPAYLYDGIFCNNNFTEIKNVFHKDLNNFNFNHLPINVLSKIKNSINRIRICEFLNFDLNRIPRECLEILYKDSYFCNKLFSKYNIKDIPYQVHITWIRESSKFYNMGFFKKYLENIKYDLKNIPIKVYEYFSNNGSCREKILYLLILDKCIRKSKEGSYTYNEKIMSYYVKIEDDVLKSQSTRKQYIKYKIIKDVLKEKIKINIKDKYMDTFINSMSNELRCEIPRIFLLD